MIPRSAGILVFRRAARGLEILLVHPGGPFWAKKDAGAWQIPKGGLDRGETAAAAARREVIEELGSCPDGPLTPLGEVRQSGGKIVEAFALEGDLDTDAIVSNSFEIEWPPRSGQRQSFPEVDRASWFSMAEARTMMLPSQQPLLDRLQILADGTSVNR